MGIKDFLKLSGNKSNKTKDPVCGMSVDLGKTKFKSKFKEKVYVFCSQGCKNSFDINPSLYI